MAMDFREPNEVLWRGVRPAHKGTQISVYTNVTDERNDIYQVPAGKVAQINTVVLGVTGTGSGQIGLVHTRSDNTVIAYLITTAYVGGENFGGVCIVFPEPLELSNQEKLRVGSWAANVTARGYCKGRYE